jgi:hypothetical protein
VIDAMPQRPVGDMPSAGIGRALRSRRAAQAISAIAAAASVGMTASELREIEDGVRSPSTHIVGQLLALYAEAAGPPPARAVFETLV